MALSPLISELINALQVLPGVGPKSAQRMALHLLQRDREGGVALATQLERACAGVGYCKCCQTLSDTSTCRICSDSRRDSTMLCVVESPADVLAVEVAGGYNGLYFVLHGHLSPIDGIGPEQLGMAQLAELMQRESLKELIVATNPTVEGEATAHYIRQLTPAVAPDTSTPERVLKISRIAHGVPVGGELEYVDSGTIVHALAGRRQL